MGIFDRFKKKVTELVDRGSEAVARFDQKTDTAALEVLEKTAEVIQLEKIKEGLAKTSSVFVNRLQSVIGIGRKIDAELLDEIEEILLTADVGVTTSEAIMDGVRKRVKKEGYEDSQVLYRLLKEEILKILVESPDAERDASFQLDAENLPYVLMVVGVNGVGKTTTIGKLSHNYKNNGWKVLIGAADTFRAAANEQLEVWARRADVEIIQQKQGADPAAVAYDTVSAALARKSDIVIIDTAGRLHNKQGLMAELEKIGRVMKKLKPTAPNDVFLVLDATTGQNAIQQAKEFTKVTPITGIVLTKLDGTAKGGVVIAIAHELQIPVRYIGVGEKIDDLQPFDAQKFVDALFQRQEETAEAETNQQVTE
jgi:fused signal recognition particle receptor